MSLFTYKILDNPNYSFKVIIGDFDLEIEILRAGNTYSFSIFNNKEQKYEIQGRSILHGVDLFKYTSVPYYFICVHPKGIDNDVANAELILDDEIQSTN